MVSPEIMTNLGPRERIHRDLRQADKSHNTQHKANAIIIVFLTGTTGTMINRDRQGSTKSRIKCILLITLPPHLHSLQAPTCLVTLLCNLQKCSHIHLKFLQHSRNHKSMFTRNLLGPTKRRSTMHCSLQFQSLMGIVPGVSNG